MRLRDRANLEGPNPFQGHLTYHRFYAPVCVRALEGRRMVCVRPPAHLSPFLSESGPAGVIDEKAERALGNPRGYE